MTVITTIQMQREAAPDHHTGEHTTPQPHRQPRDGLRARIARAQLDASVDRWLARYSLPLLRISMGAITFGFGVLKYFPGLSPAQDLVLTTTDVLTFGLVPAGVALMLLATVECGIGLSLISGRGLRGSIYLTALWVMGILSPLVVLPGRLFSGPNHAPTLEGQYVLKDLVVLAAILVIATTVRRNTTGQNRAGQTERAAQATA